MTTTTISTAALPQAANIPGLIAVEKGQQSKKEVHNNETNHQKPFLPIFTPADRYLAAFYAAGIIDEYGNLKSEYANRSLSELGKAQIDAIIQSLTSPFKIKLKDFPLEIEVTIFDILTALKERAIKRGIKVENREYVGGVVRQLLGPEFFTESFKSTFSEVEAQLGGVSLQTLINPDLLEELKEIPNDIDGRLWVEAANAELNYLVDLETQYFTSLIPPGTVKNEDCLEYLKEHYPKKYSLCDENTNLLHSLVKETAFLKLKRVHNDAPELKKDLDASALKEDNFHILACGKREDIVFDLAFGYFKRKYKFREDSLRISLEEYLETKKPSSLCLVSDFAEGAQVLSDWNGKVIEVSDAKLVNYLDWATLISQMTSKGKRILCPGKEKMLLKALIRDFKKDNLSRPKKRSFSEFVSALLKNRLLDHHKNNPEAAIALTFNCCTSLLLLKNLRPIVIEKIWTGMSSEFSSLNQSDENTLLKGIDNAIRRDKIPFKQVAAWLQVVAFIASNASADGYGLLPGPAQAVLTRHEGPALEIKLMNNEQKCKNRLLYRFDLPKAFSLVQQTASSQKGLQEFLTAIVPCLGNGIGKTSPLGPHIKDLQLDSSTMLEVANKLLKEEGKALKIMGYYLLCIHHSTYNATTTLKNILDYLPIMLFLFDTVEERKAFLQKIETFLLEANKSVSLLLPSLEALIVKPELTKTEFLFTWIVALASTNDPFFWLMAIENVLKLYDSLEEVEREKALMQIIKALLPEKISFAIYLLSRLQEKEMLSSFAQLKVLAGLCIEYPKSKDQSRIHQDVFELVDLTSKSAASQSEIPDDPKVTEGISKGFHWLVNAYIKAGQIKTSFTLLSLLVQKELLPSDDETTESLCLEICKSLAEKKADFLTAIENWKEAKKLRVSHFIGNDSKRLEFFLLVINELYKGKDEADLLLADEFCGFLIKEKIPEHQTAEVKVLIQKYMERRFVKGRLQNVSQIIDSTNFLDQEKKFSLSVRCFERHLEENYIQAAAEDLMELMKFSNGAKQNAVIQSLLLKFILRIKEKPQLVNEKNLPQMISLISQTTIPKIFENNVKELFGLYIEAISILLDSKDSHHDDSLFQILLKCISIEKLDQIKAAPQLSQKLSEALIKCLNLQLALQYQKSFTFKAEVERSFVKIFKHLKNAECSLEICQLFNAFENHGLNMFSSKERLEDQFSAVCTGLISSNEIDITAAKKSFEIIVSKYEMDNEYIQTRISDCLDRLFKIPESASLIHLALQKMGKHPRFDPKRVFTQMKLLHQHFFERNEIVTCGQIILEMNELFAGSDLLESSEIDPSLAVQSILRHPAKPKRKVQALKIALKIILEYNISSKDLWENLFSQVAKSSNKELYENAWNACVNLLRMNTKEAIEEVGHWAANACKEKSSKIPLPLNIVHKVLEALFQQRSAGAINQVQEIINSKIINEKMLVAERFIYWIRLLHINFKAATEKKDWCCAIKILTTLSDHFNPVFQSKEDKDYVEKHKAILDRLMLDMFDLILKLIETEMYSEAEESAVKYCTIISNEFFKQSGEVSYQELFLEKCFKVIASPVTQKDFKILNIAIKLYHSQLACAEETKIDDNKMILLLEQLIDSAFKSNQRTSIDALRKIVWDKPLFLVRQPEKLFEFCLYLFPQKTDPLDISVEKKIEILKKCVDNLLKYNSINSVYLAIFIIKIMHKDLFCKRYMDLLPILTKVIHAAKNFPYETYEGANLLEIINDNMIELEDSVPLPEDNRLVVRKMIIAGMDGSEEGNQFAFTFAMQMADAFLEIYLRDDKYPPNFLLKQRMFERSRSCLSFILALGIAQYNFSEYLERVNRLSAPAFALLVATKKKDFAKMIISLSVDPLGISINDVTLGWIKKITNVLPEVFETLDEETIELGCCIINALLEVVEKPSLKTKDAIKTQLLGPCGLLLQKLSSGGLNESKFCQNVNFLLWKMAVLSFEALRAEIPLIVSLITSDSPVPLSQEEKKVRCQLMVNWLGILLKNGEKGKTEALKIFDNLSDSNFFEEFSSLKDSVYRAITLCE